MSDFGYSEENEQCAWKLFRACLSANIVTSLYKLSCQILFLGQVCKEFYWKSISVPKLWIQWLMVLFLFENFLHLRMYNDI